MTKLRILVFTVQETLREKMMIAYLFFSAVVVVSLTFTLSMSEPGQVHGILLRWGPVPIAEAFQGLTRYAGSLLVIMGVISTSHLVNEWLEKGTLDLLLSKPLSRAHLLVLRSFGVVLGISLNVIVFVFSLVVVFGIKISVWNWGLLFSGIGICLWFLCFASLITLFAVLTRRTSWTLLCTYSIYFFSSLFLEGRELTLYRLWDNPMFHSIVDLMYYALPQFRAMSNTFLQMSGASTSNPALFSFDLLPLAYSLLSALCIYGIAGLSFSKKDY